MQENSVPDILCEFLEIAIHNILYTRKLYPTGIFAKRKKYGIVVHQSIHPHLNEYITECLKALVYLIKEKQIRKLILYITNTNIILEKYVFDIINLKQDISDDPFFVALEQCLRTFCLKLSTNSEYLSPLPQDCTFRIQLHTNEYTSCLLNEDPSFEHFPWIPVETKDSTALEIIPLYTIQSKCIHMQMYIEKISEHEICN